MSANMPAVSNMKTITFLFFCGQFICIKNSLFETECINTDDDAPIVEFYTKDDSLFMLFAEPVAWFEALSVCKTYEAELCMPNSTKKANFIINSLRRSNSEYKTFWVGAQKIKNNWVWLDGQLLKDSNLAIPWPSNITTDELDCLKIEENPDKVSMLTAFPCYSPVAFICERSVTVRTNKPLPSLPAQRVQINTSIYTFYHSRITWIEALAFCRTLGQRLAVVPGIRYVNILSSEMLKTRPTMENAWVGGYYNDGTWSWLSTGIEIPNTTDKYGYPPWYTNKTRRFSEACLSLDRHLQLNNFMQSSCQRRRDFICEKYVVMQNPIHNNTIECIHNTKGMIIYLLDRNWTDAQTFCYEKGYLLAEAVDNATLKAIAVCLGDHPAEPKHVWLGSKLIKNKWIWVNSTKDVDNSLPWCEDEFELNSECLNMDRTDHDEPWIYGLQCKRKQPFVCMFEAKSI